MVRVKDAPQWKVVVVWVLTVILALLMAVVGSSKFTQPEPWTRMASALDPCPAKVAKFTTLPSCLWSGPT